VGSLATIGADKILQKLSLILKYPAAKYCPPKAPPIMGIFAQKRVRVGLLNGSRDHFEAPQFLNCGFEVAYNRDHNPRLVAQRRDHSSEFYFILILY
jgi:hypothetical protein